MRITENRLRRVIRQVIKESISSDLMIEKIKSEMMKLGKSERGYNLNPGPDGDEHLIYIRCQQIEDDFALPSGSIFDVVSEACEEFSPGSMHSDVLIMQCLQRDDLEQIIDYAIQLFKEQYGQI